MQTSFIVLLPFIACNILPSQTIKQTNIDNFTKIIKNVENSGNMVIPNVLETDATSQIKAHLQDDKENIIKEKGAAESSDEKFNKEHKAFIDRMKSVVLSMHQAGAFRSKDDVVAILEEYFSPNAIVKSSRIASENKVSIDHL